MEIPLSHFNNQSYGKADRISRTAAHMVVSIIARGVTPSKIKSPLRMPGDACWHTPLILYYSSLRSVRPHSYLTLRAAVEH